MSRELPVRPHLDHLRKQAKELLEQMQQHDPAAQLADAQWALAKEYGFTSWPRLKAHVESMEAPLAASPFAGHWVADVERSTRHPLNQFRTATLDISVDVNQIAIVDVVIDAAGRAQESRNRVVVDGRAHTLAHDYIMTASWQSSHAFDTSVTQHGEVVGWGRYEVSDDGGMLTVSAADQRVVFVRAVQ